MRRCEGERRDSGLGTRDLGLGTRDSGLGTREFIDQLITSLGLKKAIMNHYNIENCFIDKINLTRIYQETGEIAILLIL